MMPYLENNGVIISFQVKGKDVGVHERASALGEDVDGLLEELDLDPGHVVLLHFIHLLTNRCVELVLKFKRLHVVHVSESQKVTEMEKRIKELKMVGAIVIVIKES